MTPTHIAATIAAAGQSTRMGQPKQLLSWGNSTILVTVVRTLRAGGAHPVIAVLGHRAPEMRATLTQTDAIPVFNPEYRQGEMLSSLQAGVRYLLDDTADGFGQPDPHLIGTLISLGDQPHVPVSVVEQVIEQAKTTPDQIVMPSFQMRRGHPFYLPKQLWPELLALDYSASLRALINRYANTIAYVNVQTDSILLDIDIPEQYQDLVRASRRSTF